MILVKTRAEQVYDYLLESIRNMTTGNNKLPSEEELSSTLGVSRATIRDALKELLRNGYIKTIHGKGTFGLPSVLRLKNRTNLTESFLRLISSSFTDARLEIEWIGFQNESKIYISAVPELNEPVHLTKWVYHGGNRLLIYGESEIIQSAFLKEPDEDNSIQDLAEFAVKKLREPLAYIAYNVNCELNPKVASLLGIPEDKPIILWDERYFDISDKQCGAGKYYFHSDMALTTTISIDRINSLY